MRIYQFKKAADNIDVSVVTDAIGDQLRFTVTETPRGISYPGAIPEEADNNKIFGMGFDFVAGTEREHYDFVKLAVDNGLQLIQWNEGLGELSPIELLPETLVFEYAIAVTPTTMTIAAAGGTQAYKVVSTKKVTTDCAVKDVMFPCQFSGTLTGDGFTIDLAKGTITAAANTGAQRTGTATFTQAEGSPAKTATIAITQSVGA